MATLTRATVGAEVRQAEEKVEVAGLAVAQDPVANRRRLEAIAAEQRKRTPASQKISQEELELGAASVVDREIKAELDRAHVEVQRTVQQARADMGRYERERKALPLEAPTAPPGDLSGFGDLIAEIRGLRYDGKLDRLDRQYAGAPLADLWQALEKADAEDPVAAAWLERRIEHGVTSAATGPTPAELTRNKVDQKRIGALLEARQAARLSEADRHALAEWRVRLDTVDAALSKVGLTLSLVRSSPSISLAKFAKRGEGI
jgi:hypothetical protein